MPIEYTVTKNGQRIETWPKGVLDITETLNYFRRIESDARIKQNAVEIVSFMDVTDFKISYAEMKEITESFQGPKAIQRISKTIFVCTTDLAFGLGRMLQTLHEITNPEHKVVVVRSESEVEDVIKKQ